MRLESNIETFKNDVHGHYGEGLLKAYSIIRNASHDHKVLWRSNKEYQSGSKPALLPKIHKCLFKKIFRIRTYLWSK